MRTLGAALLVPVVLALAMGTARAADPVNAAVSIDRATIAVGDRIALSVIVDADVGYLPSDPTIARQIGSFEVVQSRSVQRSNRGSQVRFIYRYSITAWVIGDLVLPSIAVPYVGPNGITGTAQTGGVPIRVVTVVSPGENIDDIKPLKPQLAVGEEIWPAVVRIAIRLTGALALAAVAAVVFWLLLRRRLVPSPVQRLTPVQRTMRELDLLALLRLPEQGRTAEHYERLTAALRQYLVDRFGIQPGRTSREIRVALERAGLERTQAAALFEILREGDEVRFRHARPYPAHALRTARTALEIVRRAASSDEYETGALRTQ